jgi:DNA invertase Pin-like site-specific DNA recombinase
VYRLVELDSVGVDPSPKAKKIADTKTKGARHCSKFGGAGHTSRTCTASAPTPLHERKTRPSKEELREEVQTLKADGMDSIEIAKKLGITLTLVGKLW